LAKTDAWLSEKDPNDAPIGKLSKQKGVSGGSTDTA